MNLSHTLYVTVEVKAINDVIVINSVMNLSHTLHVTVNVKALLSILYNSGNIQIKSCRGPIAPLLSVTLIWQKPQYPEG